MNQNSGDHEYQGKGAKGGGDYIVQQGDCLSSIAHGAGHFWKTLWDHADNADLRKARGSPNILLPGDRLTVPPLREKTESCAVDRRHTFVRKGEPARLRLRVMMETLESLSGEQGQANHPPEEPRINQRYVIIIDGRIHEGTTDHGGWIDIPIPCDAQHGKLTIGPDDFEVDLDLGHLDPVEEISGLQTRLTNLGYVCLPTGVMDDDTHAAIRLFQAERGLERTGELDEATRNKIRDVHGT